MVLRKYNQIIRFRFKALRKRSINKLPIKFSQIFTIFTRYRTWFIERRIKLSNLSLTDLERIELINYVLNFSKFS